MSEQGDDDEGTTSTSAFDGRTAPGRENGSPGIVPAEHTPDVTARYRDEVQALLHTLFGAFLQAREPTLHDVLQSARALDAHEGALLIKALQSVGVRFQLTAIAEEVAEARKIRLAEAAGGPDAVIGSFHRALGHAAARGVGDDDLTEALASLRVTPTITAHPTEAKRVTVLEIHRRMHLTLVELETERWTAREREDRIDALRNAIALLWMTGELRLERPTLDEEVSWGLHFFNETLVDGTRDVGRDLADALSRHFPTVSIEAPAFLTFGSWIGGDRDGKPDVTTDVTRHVLRRHRDNAIGRYVEELERARPHPEHQRARQPARRSLSWPPRGLPRGHGRRRGDRPAQPPRAVPPVLRRDRAAPAGEPRRHRRERRALPWTGRARRGSPGAGGGARGDRRGRHRGERRRPPAPSRRVLRLPHRGAGHPPERRRRQPDGRGARRCARAVRRGPRRRRDGRRRGHRPRRRGGGSRRAVQAARRRPARSRRDRRVRAVGDVVGRRRARRRVARRRRGRDVGLPADRAAVRERRGHARRAVDPRRAALGRADPGRRDRCRRGRRDHAGLLRRQQGRGAARLGLGAGQGAGRDPVGRREARRSRPLLPRPRSRDQPRWRADRPRDRRAACGRRRRAAAGGRARRDRRREVRQPWNRAHLPGAARCERAEPHAGGCGRPGPREWRVGRATSWRPCRPTAAAAYRELVEMPGFLDYFLAASPVEELSLLRMGSPPVEAFRGGRDWARCARSRGCSPGVRTATS